LPGCLDVILNRELVDVPFVGKLREIQTVELVNGDNVVMIVGDANFRCNIFYPFGAERLLVFLCDTPYQISMMLEPVDERMDKFLFFFAYPVGVNGRLRDELLNIELFLSVNELTYVADRWRMVYNHYWPQSSLDYMDPTALSTVCL